MDNQLQPGQTPDPAPAPPGTKRRVYVQRKDGTSLRSSNLTRTCKACGETLPYSDRFCPHCGQTVLNNNPTAVQKIHKGTQAIKWTAILFFVFGTLMGVIHMATAREAKQNLAQYDAEMVWPELVNGKEVTVGELSGMIDQEVILLFGTNYFLGAVMIGLFFWSRKNPFPATTTALGIYLAVIVLNAIVEPVTLIQGILIKILVITALVSGIKSSLATRVRRPAQAAVE